MAESRKGSRIRAAEAFAALDEIAEAVAVENEGKYTAAFGGEVHKRFAAWRRENPDPDDEMIRTYRDLQRWDESKKPQVSKSQCQGVLGFYDPNAHLAVDEQGGRVRFEMATMQHWDAWFEVQEAEFRSQARAFAVKRDIYRDVRSQFKGARDTVGRVMREDFGWSEDLELSDPQEDLPLAASETETR